MFQSLTRAAIAGTLTLCVSLAALPAHAGTAYTFTVGPANTLTYSFSANAPIGTQANPPATSNMRGENNAAATNGLATRTKSSTNCFSGSTTINDLIPINSGTIVASGSSSASPAPAPVHPGGTFKLGIDTASATCTLEDFSVNLVQSGSIDGAANLNNLSFPTFCVVNPSCFIPAVPISFALGTVSVTSLQAAQTPATPAGGTLTPGSPAGTWNFSVTSMMTVTPTVSFAGSPIPADPTPVSVTFSGTVTPSGATATITGTAHLVYQATNNVPAPQTPTVFTIPASTGICVGANLLLNVTVLSSSVNTDTTSPLNSSGTKIPCKCDTNNDGAVTVGDIFAFLSLWFAGSPQADFNGGGLSVGDIFAFLSCWFGKPFGC